MDINAIIAALSAVATAVAVVATKFAVPLLQAKHATEKAKLVVTQVEGYTTIIKQAVDAADQALSDNTEKKAYAVNFAVQMGVPKSAAEVMVEAAVKVLKTAKNVIDQAREVEENIDNALEGGMDDATAEDDTEELSKWTTAAGNLGVTITSDMTLDQIKTAVKAVA
jgi:hypothetical protein